MLLFRVKRATIAVVLLLLLTCTASAGCSNIKWPFQSPTASPQPTGTSTGTAHTLAVFVTSLSNGGELITGGTTNTAQVTVQPGNGQVFVTTTPLIGLNYSESARVAVAVAAQKANVDPKLYNFQFTIPTASNESVEDGPSAGAALTIATYAALTNKTTNPYVYETGTINPDGTIGQVGGVYWKGVAAAQAGAQVILVPPTQSYVDKDPYQQGVAGVNLQQELQKSGYNVRVIEVPNIDEALPYYFS